MLVFFGMKDCKPSRTPLPLGTCLNKPLTSVDGEHDAFVGTTPFQQLVGCLLHLSSTTRPDIAYAAGYLSRFMQNPTVLLWKAGKQVLRYLKGTRCLGIVYRNADDQGCDDQVVGFSDADRAQEKPLRKSISGYIFMFACGPISCRSKRQSMIAQGTLETEYIAIAFAILEALWIRKLGPLFPKESNISSLLIKEENQGCFSVAKNDTVNDRSKHIDVKYQMIMDNVKKGIMKLEYVPTDEMLADGLT